MSYQRDNDSHTRGVNAIAALDGASSRRRLASRAQARQLALRDRAMAGFIPKRPLSLGATNQAGTILGTRGMQAILKSGGLQEGTSSSPMGRPQHTGRGSIPPGTPKPPPITNPIGTAGSTIGMTLTTKLPTPSRGASSPSSRRADAARRGSPHKGGGASYQPPAITPVVLLPVPPVTMPPPSSPGGGGGGGGGGTWGGGGGIDLKPAEEEKLELPPMAPAAPTSGISTTTLLLLGAGLLGGYYLLTRDED